MYELTDVCEVWWETGKRLLPAACSPSHQIIFWLQGCWGPQSSLLYRSGPRWISGCGKHLHERKEDLGKWWYICITNLYLKLRTVYGHQPSSSVWAAYSTGPQTAGPTVASVQTHCWNGAGLWEWLALMWAPAFPGLSSPLCKPLPPPPGWSHSHDPTRAPASACSSSLGRREGKQM